MRLNGERFVIEMAPVWGNADPDRGVVAEGPVGGRGDGPARGRAPDWDAGLVVAARDGLSVSGR